MAAYQQLELPFKDEGGPTEADFDQGDDYDAYEEGVDWDAFLDDYFDSDGAETCGLAFLFEFDDYKEVLPE